jgi:spermidine synthase
MVRLFVILAFFVSGASSLMLEVVWSKALGHVLGNTLEAITTVVASYMGGLALGASWAGRAGLGQKRPVLAYGVLEIGIGLFGILSPFLIRALDGPLGAAYATFGATSPAYAAIRFLATFGLLLVPTTMMGATLPILVSWGVRRADLARVLGTLYAVNTAGAVAGTLLAGFVLMPTLGLTRTALAAGLTSLTLGAIMALLDRRLPAETRAPAAPEARPARPAGATPGAAVADPGGTGRARLMLLLFALSGGVSLATQIAWSRVGAILLGSSVYSFTLVLATFLVGIAAGAALVVPWITRRGATWRLFAVLQWIAAAGVLYASIRIADAPWSLLANVIAANGRVRWLWVQEILLLAGFMLPACLAFGAIFPVATRLSALPGDTPSHTTGRAYGWNTLGTITGSLLAGFLLVRALGMHGTLVATAAIALAIGFVAWFAAPAARPRRRSSIPEGAPIAALAVPALVLASFVVAAFFAPPWNRGLLAIGVFRPLVAGSAEQAMTPAAARQTLREQMAMEELLSFEEGRQATVTVHRTKTEPPIIAIRVNGKTDASTSIDMQCQILAGQLAMMWAADSARVAIIGYGSGVTVGSALTHPLRSADVIEIEPAVLAADRFFRPYNHDPLSDPRLTLHVEDGRTFIARSRVPYDVIISEPSNPWLAGVNNLFTVDHYRMVERSLAPAGVFCQWIQLYEMSSETLASLMRSVQLVFPRAQTFLSTRDLLIIATKDGRPLDIPHVARRLARPEVAADLARIEVRTPADLVALHLGDLSAMVSTLPETPLNLDDRPYVEYRAPIDFYAVRPSQLPFTEQRVRDRDPLGDLARWTTGAPVIELASEVTHALMTRGDLARANLWLQAVLASDPGRAAGLEQAVRDAARRRDRELQLRQARQALEADDRVTARRLLDSLLRNDPDDAAALIERARVLMREDSTALARRQLERALAIGGGDDRYQASLNLGILAMREGRSDDGLAHFARASEIRPGELSGWLYQARTLVQLGRNNEAALLLGRAQSVVADTVALRHSLQQLTTTGTLQ